ncbi:MAG: hypothetical protein KGJ86_10175 [Chloroflexota bacterium]|nr:hypothetical protein [Chloroflexota bacterium]
MLADPLTGAVLPPAEAQTDADPVTPAALALAVPSAVVPPLAAAGALTFEVAELVAELSTLSEVPSPLTLSDCAKASGTATINAHSATMTA